MEPWWWWESVVGALAAVAVVVNAGGLLLEALDKALRYDHVQHLKWEAGEGWFYEDFLYYGKSPREVRPID